MINQLISSFYPFIKKHLKNVIAFMIERIKSLNDDKKSILDEEREREKEGNEVVCPCRTNEFTL